MIPTPPTSPHGSEPSSVRNEPYTLTYVTTQIGATKRGLLPRQSGNTVCLSATKFYITTNLKTSCALPHMASHSTRSRIVGVSTDICRENRLKKNTSIDMLHIGGFVYSERGGGTSMLSLFF